MNKFRSAFVACKAAAVCCTPLFNCAEYSVLCPVSVVLYAVHRAIPVNAGFFWGMAQRERILEIVLWTGNFSCKKARTDGPTTIHVYSVYIETSE